VVPRLRDGSSSRTALSDSAKPREDGRAVTLAAAERACGEPVKDSKKSSDARHRGTPTCRGDPATSLRQALTRCRCRKGTRNRARRVLAAFRMGDRRSCCSSLPAASVTGRGLQSACNHRCHCRLPLRVRFPSMKRDSFAGAFHGLVKRGMSVCTINAGCAGEELEGLAQNLASSKFCDIGRKRTLARD